MSIVTLGPRCAKHGWQGIESSRHPEHRDLGSTGCQPVGLGSLPRPGIGLDSNCVRKDVAGRAAGNCRLAACAPQNLRLLLSVMTRVCARLFDLKRR
jgi:hypothetical protein